MSNTRITERVGRYLITNIHENNKIDANAVRNTYKQYKDCIVNIEKLPNGHNKITYKIKGSTDEENYDFDITHTTSLSIEELERT